MMVFEIGNYLISPYSGNTCWKIQERASSDSKYLWKEPYYYPRSLSEAFKKVLELTLMTEPDECNSIEEAVNRIESLYQTHEQTIKNFQITPKNI